MCRPPNKHPIIHVRPFRMMPLRFRCIRNMIHKVLHDMTAILSVRYCQNWAMLASPVSRARGNLTHACLNDLNVNCRSTPLRSLVSVQRPAGRTMLSSVCCNMEVFSSGEKTATFGVLRRAEPVVKRRPCTLDTTRDALLDAM